MAVPTPLLDARLEQGALVLTVLRRQLEGEEVAAGLKEELLAAVTAHDARLVILDLKNTRYVSSIAFWPLLRLRQHLADQEGRLILCGLTGSVQEVFMMTKMVSSGGALNAPFEMAPDVETAIARMTPPPAAAT
jgi:anti-anti-sigma factor